MTDLNLNIKNSQISEKCTIYKDVNIRDSVVGESTLSDRDVLISAEVADKVSIARDCTLIHSSFGFGSYLGAGSMVKFTDVGKFCNLSWHLSIGGSNHNYKQACMYTDSWWKTTFGVGEGLAPVPRDEYTKIGNDVWVGAKANILRGVRIGDGAVIGANALVLKDVPPYCIAVGSPARIIKKRFSDEVIRRLLAVKWWDWDPEMIADSYDQLHGELDEDKLNNLELLAVRFGEK